MRWFQFAVLVLVTAVLQAGLVNIIAVANIKPDLPLILMVFFAIYVNPSEAIITSFTIGFAADIIMLGSAMGPRIISFGLLGTLLAHLNRLISIRKLTYQSAVIFIVTLLAGALTIFLTFLKAKPLTPDTYNVLFGTALYSAIVGPFLFLPFSWWMRIKTHRLRRN